MYDNTYVCQKVKSWLKEEEKEEEEKEEEEEEKEEEKVLNCNTTKLLKKLDYQQPLQAFLRRVCWGRVDFLKGSIVIYSWYRYLWNCFL